MRPSASGAGGSGSQGEGQYLRIVFLADRIPGDRGHAERLLAYAHRVGEKVEQRISRRFVPFARERAARNPRNPVEVAQLQLVVMAVQRCRDAHAFQRLGHLLPVRQIPVERIVAEAYDPLAGPCGGRLAFEPCEVFAPYHSVGHFHIRPAGIAQKEITLGAGGDASRMSEQTAECRAAAFGPRRFVVARHREPRLAELRHESVHMRQLAVAPHVRQVAAEDDQIGVRSVRLRDGDPEERILRVARRDVYVGEENGAERIGGRHLPGRFRRGRLRRQQGQAHAAA